jgi:hypothetical protein
MQIVTPSLWPGEKPWIMKSAICFSFRRENLAMPEWNYRPKERSNRLPTADRKGRNPYVTFSPRSEKNLKFRE